MAVVVHDDEKPKLRCLDAGRYAVALTVAVLVVVVIVHAIVTVLRHGDVIVRLDGGHVSVNNVSGNVPRPTLSMKFTLQAINPSDRVRIYFTDILANISTSLTGEDMVVVRIKGGFDVGPQDSADVIANTLFTSATMAPDAFGQLYRGRSIVDAILKLSGNRIVETYAGSNDTGKQVLYYCSSITISVEDPEDAPPYVPCTEQASQWW